MEELGIPVIHQDSEAVAGKLFSHVMLMVALTKKYTYSAKHILHMICTEFKTHADCTYTQNVFPSMHAPWTHTKDIHIACAQLAPFCTHAKCVHLFSLF